MMDDDSDEDFMPPPYLVNFSVPNEPDLLVEYELYRPSMATRRLHSERNREVYSEGFIENVRLGTLSDLCVRALAKMGTRYIVPYVKQNETKLRIHYDSLDVNTPLEECYFVEDVRFWRRVVLAKSTDKTLQFKRIEDFDWRGEGIGLKYVEMVEACPAAYWPEAQMTALAILVKKYVHSMHFRHLQSLDDHFFSHFVESEPELDASSAESIIQPVSSDESDTHDEEESAEEEQELVEPVKTGKKNQEATEQIVTTQPRMTAFKIEESKESILVDDLETQMRQEARHARNAARQQLRELAQEKKEERERRKEIRAILKTRPPPPPKVKKAKKKPKPQPIDGAFNIPVDPEPDDGEDKIADHRNKEKLISHIKRYDYPAKHCNHIDLSFLRYFDMLNSLTIEFLGPHMDLNYHKRHMNFSYNDVVHLASGVRTLKHLKTFRLRNSRMDHLKLLIIVQGLKMVDSLEVIDLSYDQLRDDCNVALGMLLERAVILKGLELRYNKLDRDCMESIGYALNCYAKKNPNAAGLQYLGLSHNPLKHDSLNSLFCNIINTDQVVDLDISGIEAEPISLARDVSTLLRNHAPLRRLDISANKLNPAVGKIILRALETNHKVLHFECRGSDLSLDQEYEADVIIRRNDYSVRHPFLGDTEQTEDKLLKYLSGLRNSIVSKALKDNELRAECIQHRPPILVSSESSVCEEEHLEEKVSEHDFDIWMTLGASKETLKAQEKLPSFTTLTSIQPKFTYDANSFDLSEIREHLYLPGPSNRHYYFQRQLEN